MRRSWASLAQTRRQVCLVQGASRGIGLALAHRLASEGSAVLATCRAPDRAQELRSLQASHPDSVAILRLDVADAESIAAAAEEASSHPLAAGPRGPVLDLLLNVAGMLQDEAAGVVAERSLARVESAAVLHSFSVNALGPLLMMRHFSPLLRRASAEKELGSGEPGAVAVFYSARVGSIGDNRMGGWYSYRGSKAALNQFVRCMAVEQASHKVCCLALHPGTVDTDLTRAFLRARAKYDVQDVAVAAERHLAIAGSLTMKDSGRFYDWKREEVPW